MIHLSWIPEYTKPSPPGGQSFHVHNGFIYLPQTDTINKKTPRLNITAFDNSRFEGSSQHFYFKLCYTKLWLNCAVRKGQQQSGGMTDMPFVSLIIPAVSYTHLDVYKRQSQARVKLILEITFPPLL